MDQLLCSLEILSWDLCPFLGGVWEWALRLW
jgi:hypothetical protein